MRALLLMLPLVAACAAREPAVVRVPPPSRALVQVLKAPVAGSPPSCDAPRLLTRALGCAHLVEIALGESHACALADDGRVACWGANEAGQLGDGTAVQRAEPRAVMGLADAEEIRASGRRTCARTRRGDVLCWGSNYFGESDARRELTPPPRGWTRGGTDETDRDFMLTNVRGEPSRVELPGPSTAIALGADHACALLRSGDVACWGRNVRGSLGAGPDGGFQMRVLTPKERLLRLAAGARHACGLTAGGAVICWGDGGRGQLGDGGATSSSGPRRVPSIDVVTGLALAGNRTCARRTDGKMVCFGEAHVCGGDGGAHAPAVDSQLGALAALAIGGCHLCALRDDGAIDCWDKFRRPPRAEPERMALPRATRVASGNDFACALLEDGHVACWGTNANGQLGTTFGEGASGMAALPPRRVEWQ